MVVHNREEELSKYHIKKEDVYDRIATPSITERSYFVDYNNKNQMKSADYKFDTVFVPIKTGNIYRKELVDLVHSMLNFVYLFFFVSVIILLFFYSLIIKNPLSRPSVGDLLSASFIFPISTPLINYLNKKRNVFVITLIIK
jgi:hypothetical protein